MVANKWTLGLMAAGALTYSTSSAYSLDYSNISHPHLQSSVTVSQTEGKRIPLPEKREIPQNPQPFILPKREDFVHYSREQKNSLKHNPDTFYKGRADRSDISLLAASGRRVLA